MSASVSDDLAASGPDEKLTLQAARGMNVFQRELGAQKNLVVAGADKVFIPTALSGLLERSGRLGLAEPVAIVAAGSASGIVTILFQGAPGSRTLEIRQVTDFGRWTD